MPGLPAHHHADECNCLPTVAYIRVSKVGNRERIVSPEVQLQAIVKHAISSNLRIIRLVFDINKSGQNFDREALNKVVADLQAGEYHHITVWKWSRWGRTMRGSLEMLATVEEYGGKVESATEPFDQDTASGEYNLNNTLAMAAMQGRVIGETWRGVQNNRRSAGLPHAGRGRFGYDYADQTYTIYEPEAAVLRWAYEQYVAGLSLKKLVQEINAIGHRTTLDGKFTDQSLARVMDTGFAAGLIRERSPQVLNKLRKQKLKPGNSIKDYDVWREGSQPTIISLELWQQYRDKRLRQADLPPRARKAVHALSSLLLCGLCARTMVTKYSGSARQHQWICPWVKTYHPGRSVTVSNASALTVVRGWLGERSTPEWADEVARRRVADNSRGKSESDRLRQELAQLEKELATHDALFKEASRLNAPSERTLTRHLKQRMQYERDIDSLSDRIEAIPAVSADLPNYRAFKALSDVWDSEYSPAVQRELLSKVVGMVLVSPLADPKVRGRVADRLRVVPAWEMSADWEEWIAVRRQKSA